MTRALLMAGARKVIAIEKDSRAIDALPHWSRRQMAGLKIIAEDALAVDLASLAPAGEQVRIVANLPYNIATTLLLNWLGAIDHIAR